jgi:acyl carrier protein
MNTTLRRFSEPELAVALNKGERAFTVSVSDRFGSYGLAGLVIYHETPGALVISGFSLSCRALGRGVEHRMLVHAAEIAQRADALNVSIGFAKGPRNQPARDLLTSVAGRELTDTDSITLPTADLVQLTYEPQPRRSPERRPGPAVASDTTSAARQKSVVAPVQIDYEKIAKTLDSAAKISAAIAGKRRQRNQAPRRIKARPETKLEQSLAAIWCDLLGLEEVGTEEDFFDLGGHSLLAVQLLSRIHRDLHVELPDSVIYAEKLKIENLARHIELQQLGVERQEDYAQLIAEIESLSDEEVAALLAEEERQP